MRHFIAYHNVEKMGRTLLEGQPLQILTNKSVNHLLNNVIWIIVGEGRESRTYSLGSVFIVTETGNADDSGFKYRASGSGYAFDPPVPIADTDWFTDLFNATGHFGLGVTPIKNAVVIQGLMRTASSHGFQVPIREYPEPKTVELADDVKEKIREQIKQGQCNIYLLAEQYGCSSSQIAGIKAAMNR
ncbi:hypothetical protein SH661x_000671 [Planctomicrobium sp. SH661]|uniref:hypothetical protein n=1 Tax=Planctomicrobium sp. SH661 TaxID=3448124 RepID=UPI003F5B415F